jgi:hypothetical protein
LELYRTGLGCWHRFVASATVFEGPRRWTIAGASLVGCVGVGVTTAPGNSVDDYGTRISNVGWILTILDGRYQIFHNDNGKPTGQAKPANESTAVSFCADPTTRQITALPNNNGNNILLMTAETDEEFCALRPCVVVGEVVDRVKLTSDVDN